RWFCEGKELGNSPDIQILQNADLQTLIISEAFQEDTGRYTCLASNVDGTDSTSAEIYIEGATSSDSEGEPSNIQENHIYKPKSVGFLINPRCSVEMASTQRQYIQIMGVAQMNVNSTQKVASPSFGLPGFDGQSGVMAAPVFTKVSRFLFVTA
uniref:Ig-like domain-containing protein n=1 Tax=Petromyzon marinus TaxID=7757 RepID=S4RA54_PETMA